MLTVTDSESEEVDDDEDEDEDNEGDEGGKSTNAEGLEMDAGMCCVSA